MSSGLSHVNRAMRSGVTIDSAFVGGRSSVGVNLGRMVQRDGVGSVRCRLTASARLPKMVSQWRRVSFTSQ